MSDKKSKEPLLVGGLPGAGKTSLICGLIRAGRKNTVNLAGFKPFDCNKTAIDAKELLSDGEIICRFMSGEPMVNFISPYHAYENYPVEMANRRDGIKVNWDFLQDRISLLDAHYDRTLIELPQGILSPLTEDKNVLEWMGEISRTIIWIISPEQSQFEHNLAEIWSLKKSGFKMFLILNNSRKNPDQDLLFYIWEKIEKFAGRQIEGMIPYCEINDYDLSDFITKIQENIPGLIRELTEETTEEE